LDDRRRDGGTKFILSIKEQETRLTLHEHDDDDDDNDDVCSSPRIVSYRVQQNVRETEKPTVTIDREIRLKGLH